MMKTTHILFKKSWHLHDSKNHDDLFADHGVVHWAFIYVVHCLAVKIFEGKELSLAKARATGTFKSFF